MTGGAAFSRPSLAETLEPGVEAGLLHSLRALVLHLAGRCVRRPVGAAHRRGGLREGQRRVRGAVGELLDRRLVEVAEVVARLLGRLDVFRAAEEAAGRDARVYERFVVGASIELGRLGLEPLGGEVVEEYVLYRPRAARPGGPEGVPVAVVDEPDEVRRAYHVEVQVDGDVLLLPRGQLVDIVRGTVEPLLLGAPEREADVVDRLDVELLHLQGDLQDARRARAVVVDAGSLGDGVEVSPHDDRSRR
jgi:hypothetical protein